MRGRYIGFIIGVVLGFTLTWSTFSGYKPEYDGKISMTESQYSGFKQAIAQKDVEVDSINVLNTNEPVVVIFDVRTKAYFPYGDKKENPVPWIVPLITVLMGILGYCGGYMFGERD